MKLRNAEMLIVALEKNVSEWEVDTMLQVFRIIFRNSWLLLRKMIQADGMLTPCRATPLVQSICNAKIFTV
jgi:hypothetical protein